MWSQIVSTFIASSAIALLLASVYTILNPALSPEDNLIDYWIPELLPLFKESIKDTPSAIARLRRLKSGVPHLTRKATRKQEFWARVIEKIILNLSDQLLLTGLAVLIAGFWTRCSISVYHFALVSDLAWFASNVHLTTLAVLWKFLQDRPVLKNWRAAVMSFMAILLVASTVLQGHEAWYDSWPYRAQCVFDDYALGNLGGEPARWMYTNLVLIVVDYPSSIIMLYPDLRDFGWRWLFTNPTEGMQRIAGFFKRKRSLAITSRARRALYLFCIASIEVFRRIYSFLVRTATCILVSRWFNLLFNLAWFILGLVSVFEDRNIPKSDMDGDENTMSFGQIVPILLLTSTVVVSREAYDGKTSDNVRKRTPLRRRTDVKEEMTRKPTRPSRMMIIGER